MGDWQGRRKLANGREIPVAAQIICWGRKGYQANILEKFNQPVGTPALVKLVGRKEGDKIVFDEQLKKGNLDQKKDKLIIESSEWRAELTKDRFIGKNTGTDKSTFEMKEIERKSPELDKKPPKGAVVLFDSKNIDEWASVKKIKSNKKNKKGKAIKISVKDPDAEVKWEILDNGAFRIQDKKATSIASKKDFGDVRLHIEFRTPFMPDSTGQKRGNSGIYFHGKYEVQILDSYGLEGEWNECGGIYKVARPAINMCAPPMQWQTYDVIFKAPKFDENDEKIKNARITVEHNGVKIHDDIELPKATQAAISGPEAPKGPIYLQNHGNPVQFRNIWIVEN